MSNQTTTTTTPASASAAPARTVLLRLPEVLRRTGMNKALMYRQIAVGQFPAPVSLGLRAVAWIETEIDEWIAARVAERGPATAEMNQTARKAARVKAPRPGAAAPVAAPVSL